MSEQSEQSTSGKKMAVGVVGSRVEYEMTQRVWVELREGVATFVFGVKEHNRRVVVPADVYLGFLEDLLAKALEKDAD